jgi:hypothetical protein
MATKFVARADPRYLDRNYWAEPTEGQTVLQARIEQAAAIDQAAALHRRRFARIKTATLPEGFAELIPRRPYCADELSHGLRIRPRVSALRMLHVQLNGPDVYRWMVHDIDLSTAREAHERAGLPPPNFIAINRENGHAHSAYILETPVARHDMAEVRPLRFFADVERGIARRLSADLSYAGLVTKNPTHPIWDTEWRRTDPYSLRSLNNCLSAHDKRREVGLRSQSGAGRNCTIFDELRHPAYRRVRSFKNQQRSRDEWFDWCLNGALDLNVQFASPLGFSEVKAIAKSVCSWTWRHFSVERYRQIQSRRSQLANSKRWGDDSAEKRQPWVEQGISRSTYYRRKAQPGGLRPYTPRSSVAPAPKAPGVPRGRCYPDKGTVSRMEGGGAKRPGGGRRAAA